MPKLDIFILIEQILATIIQRALFNHLALDILKVCAQVHQKELIVKSDKLIRPVPENIVSDATNTQKWK